MVKMVEQDKMDKMVKVESLISIKSIVLDGWMVRKAILRTADGSQ